MIQGRRLRVFLSYSRKDESYLNELVTHLTNLVEEGCVQLWHDRAIRGGEEWEPSIREKLDQADVIVLLISADFSASSFCRNQEMKRAIQRHRAGTAVVIPVVVRHVEALPKEITHLQTVPRDRKPIAAFEPKDEGYKEVAGAIRAVVERLSAVKANVESRDRPPVLDVSAGWPSSITADLPDQSDPIDLPSAGPLAICLVFTPSNGGYKLDMQAGFGSEPSSPLPHVVRLGKHEKLRIGDGPEATLGELVQRLIDYQKQDLPWFEERGQLVIGRRLFDETVGRIEGLARRDQVDLRIVTDDEHLLRLPWPLLNRRGIFLIHEDWCTSLSTRGKPLQAATLVTRPSILVINPDPDPNAPTSGSDHVNDLRALLRGEDYDLGSPEKMVEVQTWDELKEALATNSFDVVYYYGHGEGDMNRTRFLFEASGNGEAEPHSFGDFANLLRRSSSTPKLAYVNCCHGDSGGLLGIGTQLGSFIPSVVTNRTVAGVDAARKQACSFFRQVLLDSVKPHEAVAALYRDLPGEVLDGIRPEWFTPVHHANYSEWNHVSPRDANRHRVDPNWRWLLDRRNQYGTTAERLRSIVNRQIKKRALAIVAYGAPGNGLRHFQERIRCFVHESVDVDGKTYKPSWAPYQARDGDGEGAARRDRSFLQILETCGHSTLSELVRECRHGVSGTRTLTVFNHAIVSSPEVLNSRRLFEYFEWWDHNLAKEIDDESLFFLFATYFEVPGGKRSEEEFQDAMKTARRNVRLSHIDVDILLPLTRVDENDLLQFIDDHDLFIPQDRREKVAESIIRRTDGEYERAVAELERIVQGQYEILTHESEGSKAESNTPSW